MSDDLISRKAVIELIESKLTDGHLQMGDDIPLIDAAELLDDVFDIPAAYDVDKVVEQLKTRRYEKDRNIDSFGSPTSYIAYCVGLNDAEDIVKGGGVDE